MTPYDIASFAAGKDAGTRISACVVRLAALQLVEDARWWNRWRCRLMARALVTCAEEMESSADASRAAGAGDAEGDTNFRPARPGDAS